MKKLFAFALMLALFLPAAAFAAEFTATVDDAHVASGEGVTLQLTLSGAEAKGDPDTQALNDSFSVVSQGQTSSTTIINGKVDSSIGWQFTLIPKQDGHVTIPPVTIATSEGTLSTQPVTLDVGGAPPPVASNPGAPVAGGRAVSLAASASLADPYQSQPVLYTVKITARAGLSNAALDDLVVENAVVEKQGDPQSYDETENGRPVSVTVLRYLVTPLKAGKIVIPPPVLQGNIATAERTDPFADGFMDPFRMMQGFGFSALKPVRVAGNGVTLDVKPPAVAMDPWLPLTSLQIKEELDKSQQAKAGEPVTRKITILADGIAGSQLPKLEKMQNHEDFKVYADKPETGENVDKETGDVKGWRQESYSLIPEKSGPLVLPEIKIPWWNLKDNKIAYAVLPEQTIDVQPGDVQPGVEAQSAAPSIPAAAPPVAAPSTPEPQRQVAEPARPVFLYGLIAALSVILLMVVGWALRLQKRLGKASDVRATDQREATEQSLPDTGLAALEQVRTAEELNGFLRAYAHRHWNVAQNAPLEEIFKSGGDRQDIDAVVSGITGALYGGKPADVEDLKKRCRRIIVAGSGKTNDNAKVPEKLPRLNPN